MNLTLACIRSRASPISKHHRLLATFASSSPLDMPPQSLVRSYYRLGMTRSCISLALSTQILQTQVSGRSTHYKFLATSPQQSLSHLDFLRNIGVIAHIDAGKTTTTERMLYYSGTVDYLGDVDDGNTTMDFLPQERARGITIQSAAITFHWSMKHHSSVISTCNAVLPFRVSPTDPSSSPSRFQINLIDTPGHVDFTMEVETALRVLDAAVVIIDAVAGVQAQTKKVWSQTTNSRSNHKLPAVVFVNKMDKEGANFDNACQSVRHNLNVKVVPIQLPYLTPDRKFLGVVDLVHDLQILWDDPEDLEGSQPNVTEINPWENPAIAKAKENMIELLSDHDDHILDRFLNEDLPSISSEDITRTLRKGTLSRDFVPVICGSSLKNKGVQPLLDSVLFYLPSPKDRSPVEGVMPDGLRESRAPAVDGPFTALTFKVIHDQYKGPLVFFRIFSGSIKNSSPTLWNVSRQIKERANQIFQIRAQDVDPTNSAVTGSVYAASGLKLTSSGETLVLNSDPPDQRILLDAFDIPTPVFFIAIEPESSSDEEHLNKCLKIILREDSSLSLREDGDTGEVLLGGQGELHLEVVRHRLTQEMNAKCRVSKPRIAYHETVSVAAAVDSVYDRSVGDTKLYCGLRFKIEPGDRGSGNQFQLSASLQKIRGVEKKSSKEIFNIIEQGVMTALGRGLRGLYSAVDVIVTLEEDLSDQGIPGIFSADLPSLKACTSFAVRKLLEKAQCRLLEPIMKVEVSVPLRFMGAVISDLTSSKRHGTVRELIGDDDHHRVVHANVPLRGLLGYSSSLRSLTQGHGFLSMSVDTYDFLPPAVEKTLEL